MVETGHVHETGHVQLMVVFYQLEFHPYIIPCLVVYRPAVFLQGSFSPRIAGKASVGIEADGNLFVGVSWFSEVY